MNIALVLIVTAALGPVTQAPLTCEDLGGQWLTPDGGPPVATCGAGTETLDGWRPLDEPEQRRLKRRLRRR